MIAYFKGETGSEKVGLLIADAREEKLKLFATSIIVYELYYDALRGAREEEAVELLDDVYSLPVTVVETIDRQFIREAAYFKTNYTLSVADSFALALAQHLVASLVTSDHHEFDAVEESGDVKFFWIR